MADALSNYAENKLLDHLLGTAAFTMPAQVYIAAYKSDPTDADTGTEVAGGGYTRVAVDFNAAASGEAVPTAVVEFPEASAEWGTITHIALRDAAEGGNQLLHGALEASKKIEAGDVLRLTAEDLAAALS